LNPDWFWGTESQTAAVKKQQSNQQSNAKSMQESQHAPGLVSCAFFILSAQGLLSKGAKDIARLESR